MPGQRAPPCHLGSSSVSIPTQVREPAPACRCVCPTACTQPGPHVPSLAQPFSESGAWSLLSLPCAATCVGLKRCPPPRSRAHSGMPTSGILHLSICAGAQRAPAVFCVCRSPPLRTSSLSLCSRPLLWRPQSRDLCSPDCLECESAPATGQYLNILSWS